MVYKIEAPSQKGAFPLFQSLKQWLNLLAAWTWSVRVEEVALWIVDEESRDAVDVQLVAELVVGVDELIAVEGKRLLLLEPSVAVSVA